MKNFKKASFVAMIMLLSAQMGAKEPESTEPAKSSSWFTRRNAKIAAGTAAAVGATAAAAYIYQNPEIQERLTALWNSLTNSQKAEIIESELQDVSPKDAALEMLADVEAKAEIKAELQDDIDQKERMIQKDEDINFAHEHKSTESDAERQNDIAALESVVAEEQAAKAQL